MATLNITIKYPIIGYTQTVSGGVVTGTTRVVFDPNKIIDDIWPKVRVEDEFSGFNFEDDKKYIKLDEVFWENFERIIQQQPMNYNLHNLSPAWACKWNESTVQFFVGESSEPAERLPTDGGTAITAVVTGFAEGIDVNLSYKEAISGEQIGDQVKDNLNFNLTSLNEWEMNDVPDGWYAASAQLDWGPSGNYSPPDMIRIPSFFSYDDVFETNKHIPRCIVNTDNENPLTVDGTTITNFCRDAATLQVVAALNFLYKECDSIPTITVTCHKTATAPASCSAKYLHYLGNEELFTSLAKPLYLSKTFKVDNITSLCDEWKNDCLKALRDRYRSVDEAESPSIFEIEDKTVFDESYNPGWTCNASFTVRATQLKVYLSAGVTIGEDKYTIYDQSANIEVGVTKYTDLFARSKAIEINGKNTQFFLQKIAGMTLHDAEKDIPYDDTFCSNIVHTIQASYTANYVIELNFYSNIGRGDNNLYFYPAREDKIENHRCYWVQKDIVTSEDNLNKTIYDLLEFGKNYQTIDGDVFVYYINQDAVLKENRVIPDSDLKDYMKPEFSSFSDVKEQNTNILNQSLKHCIDNGFTKINFEVKPQPPRKFIINTHWKLLSKADAAEELAIVHPTLTWFTYANLDKTFEELCDFYQDSNTIKFEVDDRVVPSNQWSITNISNSNYGSDDKSKRTIPYDTTKLSDLYVLCKKLLEFVTYKINRRDNSVLTISKKDSDVYQQASLKIPDGMEQIEIAKELANQSLLPILSGGAVIFLSNGDHSAQSTFEDWPGFTDAPEADQIFYEGKKCDKLFNVNQGVGMNCQYLQILDGDPHNYKLQSCLTSDEYMYQSTIKRRFFIGLVGAGGGGGGGDLQWFDSNGGSGGGGGGYTLFACKLEDTITDKEMESLTISWSGGLGGGLGGRNSSGGSGSEATLTLSLTRNGTTTNLAEFTAYGGGGGGAYNGNGGSGADAPTHVILDDNLIQVAVVTQMNGLSGQPPKTDTEKFVKTYTEHRNYFEVNHSWIGYEIARAITPGGIPTAGGVQGYSDQVVDDQPDCDAMISGIFEVLGKAVSDSYNVYQLFPGGFSCKGGYDDNENGGPGAPSVVGPGSIFNRDGSYGYERPCPGCGGCGSGHWLRGDWWSDKDDEVPGRPGGNAMFAILC